MSRQINNKLDSPPPDRNKSFFWIWRIGIPTRLDIFMRGVPCSNFPEPEWVFALLLPCSPRHESSRSIVGPCQRIGSATSNWPKLQLEILLCSWKVTYGSALPLVQYRVCYWFVAGCLRSVLNNGPYCLTTILSILVKPSNIGLVDIMVKQLYKISCTRSVGL